MENKNPEELSPKTLEEVSGGGHEHAFTHTEVVERDSKGNPTHWREMCRGKWVSKPYYYLCPKCGRLLHGGTLGRLYCDPCDESWFAMTLTQYFG